MIELTKLNDQKIVLNSDLIEYIEVLPDSLIKLTTGMKIMVKENIPEIIAAIIEFRRSILKPNPVPGRIAAKTDDGPPVQNAEPKPQHDDSDPVG